MSNKDHPQLSIVMVGRNDNYGNNFLWRFNQALQSIVFHSKKHDVFIEMIIVEWNAPKKTLPLAKTIKFTGSRNIKLRIITVPPVLHNEFKLNRPLLEFHAKNVGIRRASADYILCTNPDIIFLDKLFELIKFNRLGSNNVYRVTRVDLQPDNSIYKKDDIYKFVDQIDAVKVGSPANSISGKSPLDFIKNLIFYLIKKIKWFPYQVPFTRAAGDFLLMHKSIWRNIRGYPELNDWHYIDGIPIWQAILMGYKQNILRFSIFHIEHNRKISGVKPMSSQVKKCYKNLWLEKDKLIINDKNWGLGKKVLKETKV